MAENVKVVKFGLGEVTCVWGSYQGLPAVFIEPAPVPGAFGTSAAGVLNALGRTNDSVADGALILQFWGGEGERVLLEDIHSARAKFSPSTAEIVTR